ncbi:MAG: histidinol dehydrogenase [Gemmatimonas sp.]
MTPNVVFRATGNLADLDSATRAVLMSRAGARDTQVGARTADIIRDVRARGDDALREMAYTFDHAVLQSLEVPRENWTCALSALAPDVRHALERAARNIQSVHQAFLPTAFETSPEPGITVGRRPDPLARVGVYAPGGRAAYPSSLLMGAIPARVAGVGEVIVCSPPSANGEVSSVVLAAAALANVDRVFAIGGAGAIAAMALGTTSVPRVDRIVGPGNAYVAEAKLQLVGQVAIDSPAGPSELFVLADSDAKPDVIAREMAAQAEHDPDVAVIAVLFGDDAAIQAKRTLEALEKVLEISPRSAIMLEAFAARGALLTADNLDRALQFANAWAPEHLLLAIRPSSQDEALSRVRAAGTVFVGETSSVAFGDYMTGANHVLPTAGLARCYSGLSTLDFVRWTSWQRVSREAARGLSRDVGVFADAEGLPAHAAAARFWTENTQFSNMKTS